MQKIRNELVQCLENSMEKLQKVWNEIGISDEQKGERTQVVLQHLQNLLNEMVDEEIELKTSLLGNVATCTEEMIRISKELGIPCFIVRCDFKYSILSLSECLEIYGCYTKVAFRAGLF